MPGLFDQRQAAGGGLRAQAQLPGGVGAGPGAAVGGGGDIGALLSQLFQGAPGAGGGAGGQDIGSLLASLGGGGPAPAGGPGQAQDLGGVGGILQAQTGGGATSGGPPAVSTGRDPRNREQVRRDRLAEFDPIREKMQQERRSKKGSTVGIPPTLVAPQPTRQGGGSPTGGLQPGDQRKAVAVQMASGGGRGRGLPQRR